MRHTFNALMVIAMRDVTKLLRDRARMVFSIVFPFVFILALGGSLDANLSTSVGYNFLVYVFTGVIAQTLFQSTASGIISLTDDRQNDFAQELFVSPVSRVVLLAGKILGESLVSLTQLISIFILGLILRIPLDVITVLQLIPVFLICCAMGGAFGVLVLSQLNDQRKANQVFPLLLFPQFFLAGVFAPIRNLPLPLYILSRISPMTYPVDLVRGVYYWGQPEYDLVVLNSPLYNLAVIAVVGTIMLSIGTYFFVKNERNK